ncbi:MAG TPA: hypothetical protein VGJ20_20590 [Xanthobacteraceae bacterium]|jgi:transcriptional regulator with XRE-family HTH domain
MKHASNERALRLVERLIKAGDEGTARRALRMRARLTATPMSIILEKVPGASVIEKAKRVGVSRQTFYYWLSGVTRPNIKQARRLATLTGYDADVIRGRA